MSSTRPAAGPPRRRFALAAAFVALVVAASTVTTLTAMPSAATPAAATTPSAAALPGSAVDFDTYAASAGLAQDHADVFRLYWAVFDRKPEVGGAQYWVGRYDQCASLLDITWSFGNSAEFANTYGSVDDRDYITLVYNNVLDRRPDNKGYEYWLALLSNGSLNRSEMMLYFSLSTEFRRRHPLPSDGVAYSGCTPPKPTTTQPPQPDPDVLYANCTEARQAGAAPIMRGEPGYRPALDRDNDGVACELT